VDLEVDKEVNDIIDELKKSDIPIKAVEFVFRAKKAPQGADDLDYVIPLSWKLTDRQKTQIDWAWEDVRGSPLELGPALKLTDEYFKPRPGQPTPWVAKP
jgi:hypothetical protein